MRCCTRDEGWPFGAALRGEASNRLMLRWLKTVVVSDEEKASRRRQVGTGKTTIAEASKLFRRHQNRGVVCTPGRAWRVPAYWPGGCATNAGAWAAEEGPGDGGAVQLMKVWPFGVALRGEASNRLMPVSYTHLRAHETGRNLVCRL